LRNSEYTLSLAQAGFDVVGGDLSKGMLTVAKSKVKGHELAQKIQLIRLESTRLPFRNEAFDTITCIAVLDWVLDSHRLLAEANRVLKHQATFIACVDALWSPYRIYRTIQLAASHCGKRYARIFNYLELKRTVIACDFIIEKFIGDVLLGQVIARLLYEPKGKAIADKVLKATQPLDSRLTDLPLFKSLSEHYIIEARKK
jgi:SAM-dependent methyltransferase